MSDGYFWALLCAKRLDPDGGWLLETALDGTWVRLVSERRAIVVPVMDQTICTDLDECDLEKRILGQMG